MGRTAVVAHGCGSTADLVRRAFARPLASTGLDLVAFDDRTGDVDAVTERLGDLVDDLGAVLVGGISLGAHAAVRVAARRPGLEGVLLALPAWTGPPGAVAALSGSAADEVERAGLEAVLALLADGGWVGRELALAWPAYGEAALVSCLRATAPSAGPTESELGSLAMPVGIAALADDPYHPLDVAQRWSELIPRTGLRVVDPGTIAADRSAVGWAAVQAWKLAQRSRSDRG
jgi:pimeloyl-ACP methyl ester carboxylesterase